MKKKRGLMFVLMLALACVFATAALAADTTTNTNANLRSGPGTQYERLAIIPAGSTVTIVAADTGNGWTQISYNNQTGYVVTRYLGTGTADAAGGTYTTTARVHLRSGPSTANSSILIIPKGATVSVSGSANGWSSASYNGQSGYIASQYLAAAGGTPTTSPTVTGNTGPAGSTSATTTANVYLRSGPGTSNKALLTVPKGASVTVNSTADGWASVTYNGQNGYISTKYLSGLAGSGGSSSTTATTTAKVNLRSGPGTGNAVVTQVPKGATVTVTSTSNGWSAVTYNGKNGYIASQYLTTGGSTGSTGSSSTTATTTAKVNMRSGPGTSNPVVTEVPKGTAVTVTSTSNGWSAVTYNGKNGYIASQYLTTGSGSTGSGTTSTTTATVNMRSGPGTSNKVLATLPKGTSVTVNSTSNGWASVTYNGTNGYISANYLSGLSGSTSGTSSTKKTTANVRLRSGAGTSSSIILTIPKGATVTVTGTSNGWSSVTYNGQSGYVSSQYLS